MTGGKESSGSRVNQLRLFVIWNRCESLWSPKERERDREANERLMMSEEEAR